LAYSLSTPGSITEACPRIKTPDAPINQKMVEMGDDNQRRGIPITKRPVYRCFCVTVCSPNCVASGAVKEEKLSIEDQITNVNIPKRLIAAKPSTRKAREIRRR
jgi:hypothetical protein